MSLPVDVTTSIVIKRPREEVYDFVCDPDNTLRWYNNIKSVEWQTPRPAGLGSKFAFQANFLGKRLSYTYEVVALIPNELFTMRTAQGPFPMETSYMFDAFDSTDSAAPSSTLMKLRNRGEPTGFSAVFAPIMATMIRRANVKDLALLKSALEGR